MTASDKMLYLAHLLCPVEKIYIIDAEHDILSVCDEEQFSLIKRYAKKETMIRVGKLIKDESDNYYFSFDLINADNSEELDEAFQEEICFVEGNPLILQCNELKIPMNDEQKKKYMEYL